MSRTSSSRSAPRRARPEALLAALLVVGLIPTTAPAEDATPPGQPVSVGPVGDSTLTRITGSYAVVHDPLKGVGISAKPSGVTYVTRLGLWESAGLFDGREYRGVLREVRAAGPQNDDKPETQPVRGTLRFELREDGTIAAELDPGSGPRRKEVWVQRAPRDSIIPPFSDPDPDAPAFGALVYVEEIPAAIERVSPYYPEEARRNDIQGTVMVQALVGRDGLVHDMRIVKSIPMLDRVAAACVWLWRFKPAMAHGKPVAVWVAVPVKFTLH